jgi:probable rRNA maturation factor
MGDGPIVLMDGEGSDAEQLEADAHVLMELVALRPEAARLGGLLELSIVVTDDAGIRPLNARWRGVDEATDVLSFPMEEGPLLGDVVVSVETARRRCNGAWTLRDELTFLLIHGVLHLLGHDHMEAAERGVMEAAEQALWTAMGRPGTLRESDGSEHAIG